MMAEHVFLITHQSVSIELVWWKKKYLIEINSRASENLFDKRFSFIQNLIIEQFYGYECDAMMSVPKKFTHAILQPMNVNRNFSVVHSMSWWSSLKWYTFACFFFLSFVFSVDKCNFDDRFGLTFISHAIYFTFFKWFSANRCTVD